MDTTKTEFDNVKYEKAKAIARFNMFQRMKFFLQVFELLVLLVLISWSANKIPSAAKFSVHMMFQLRLYLQKPHVVFLMVIFIVLALMVLCKQNDVENEKCSSDLQEEYALHSHVSTKSDEIQAPSIGILCGNNKTYMENTWSTSNQSDLKDKQVEEVVKEEMQIVVAKDDDGEEVEKAIVEAGKRIRRFERTQSEKLKRDIGVRTRKELRRWETENGRGVVGGGGDRRIVKSVDHLSNEEFKLAVDDFINKHRVFFKQ